ncbi:NAD-dependent epimerase/dehydratase family protein [Hamadaea tsunoensis]|uniref:NAD-dependent epimerase/dehydratase family protein n=1 Tax=Hamadaea tsunoensis TaxID=53368 RepID=UPI00040C5D1C|nr:NAD(P)-dependent oxidoreductase [Hamadaea tsunoensis]
MILVTGGLGFIGSHTGRALVDQGAAPVLVGRDPSRAVTTSRAATGLQTIVEGAAVAAMDCTDPASVRAVGERYEITEIVHLASAPMGSGSAYEQVKGSLLGLMTMIEAARRWGVRRMVVASTIGVYGGVEAGAAGVLGEDLLLPLASGHAIPAAKKAAEIVSGVVDDVEIVCARIGAVWGPLGRERSPFFAAPQLVHAAARQAAAPHAPTTIQAYANDGLDMLYARDCGRALAGLVRADRLRHRAYNVGSGRSTTNGEVAALLGVTLPAGGAAAAPLDVTRLRADTGFVPEWSLERAVTDYRDWLSAHER